MSTLGDGALPGLRNAATVGGILARRGASLGGRVVEETHHCTATNTITTVDYRPTLAGGAEVVQVYAAGAAPQEEGETDG